MNLNWFLSRKVRHASQMAKHVQKLVNAQRDILTPEAVTNVEKAIEGVCAASRQSRNNGNLDARIGELETAANKWLRHYPNPGVRENVEVLLVAIAVAMGIRTFFVQPFKIPTGSMQPTLYGITPSPNLPQDTDFAMPNFISRFFIYWITGISHTHVVAKADGALDLNSVEATPKKFLLFNLKQSFRAGGESYTVWFPPEDMLVRAGLMDRMGHINPHEFKKGEDLIKLRVISGDHLFVDRMTYNFRHPKRGEIIVFQTAGINGLPQDQFYIKRMVAMGGEHVRLGNDRHLVVGDGQKMRRLDASTPHFENVYSFDGPPRESTYSGHVNDYVARQVGAQGLAPLFQDELAEFVVSPNHYIVMGDNTMNSSDSRYWGDFPEENVIGRAFFVYWPIGPQGKRASRFGWGTR
jgi:signal peptidase I